MSPRRALRRSPKPGALTAATFRVPRSLLTTSVASASPSMSSAMIKSGLPPRATCSSKGSRSFIFPIFFLEDQDGRLFQHDFHATRIGDEVWAQVSTIKLHALNSLQKRMACFRILDRDDAVLADLLHGLGNEFSNFLIAVGGDGAHLGHSTLVNGPGQLAQRALVDPFAVFVARAVDRSHGLSRCRASTPSGWLQLPQS